MATRARPIHDRVIVRVEQPSTVTAGGIALVEHFQKPKRCGEVMAAGPGLVNQKGQLVPTTVKPGDRVVFGSYAGVEIEIEGESFRIMRESDLAGIVDADAEVDGEGLTTRRDSRASWYNK